MFNDFENISSIHFIPYAAGLIKGKFSQVKIVTCHRDLLQFTIGDSTKICTIKKVSSQNQFADSLKTELFLLCDIMGTILTNGVNPDLSAMGVINEACLKILVETNYQNYHSIAIEGSTRYEDGIEYDHTPNYKDLAKDQEKIVENYGEIPIPQLTDLENFKQCLDEIGLAYDCEDMVNGYSCITFRNEDQTSIEFDSDGKIAVY